MAKDEGSGTPAEKKSEPRDYIVLGKTKDGAWRELGVTRAMTDKKAIAPHALKNLETVESRGVAGTGDGAPSPETFSAFVAVPKRSWHPRQPRAKTEPQLSWT